MGDKVKANVQRCPQFIPAQRAVNYAEQARRHRLAGVNGERKLSVSPRCFPSSSQLTSSMSHRISGGACRGHSSGPTRSAPGCLSCLRLLSLQPGAANSCTPSPCQTAASSGDAQGPWSCTAEPQGPANCPRCLFYKLQNIL